MNKIRNIGIGALVVIWLALTALMWFGPKKTFSDAERRNLDQLPKLNGETLLDGSFMGEFEGFTQDQFPLRDTFRQVKSIFHNYVLRQGDNNGIYIADGYAAKMEYPLNTSSVNLCMARFQNVYDKFLKGKPVKTYVAIVPDKGYYLAEDNGYLALDYTQLFDRVKTDMSWAKYIDLTDVLEISDYYRTDTHWRQEKLEDVAKRICETMGVKAPENLSQEKLDRDFYGVYYGQAALPMEGEPMSLVHSPVIDGCQTYLVEIDEKTYKAKNTLLYEGVYDREKVSGKDMYETYLSGAQSLLKIVNPNAKGNKELVVFRDSFGSSLTPLLLEGYRTVWVVDIRYVSTQVLSRLLQFRNQDVLFLYSTLVLNTSGSALLQ